MPVTAPTSSAMVTTRIARLRLIFQLVMRFGRIAGNISLVKYCTVVGRNERIMPRSSLDTPRMASSESTRKTGPQTAISTKAIRNSTPRNHSTANRIQGTTGTAMNSRMMGCRYRSRSCDRYIAIASTRPRANDRISAPMTRATVTTTSMGVIVIMLCAMRTKLGIAKAGMPSAGAKYDSTSQTTTKIRSERRVWPENFPSRPASRYSLRRIDDLVVGHLLIEPGLHGAFHHVHNRFAGSGLPRGLHDHVETLAVHRGLENPRRQLDSVDGDLVGSVGLFVKNIRHVLQSREQHLGAAGYSLDRVRAHRGHDLPPILPRDFLPALRAVEDHLPTRILLQDDAGERLDHQGRLDAVGLQLCARDGDDGDILAELDALCIGIDLDHLKLRSPHIGRELLAFEVGERLDVGVPGKDDEIGKREAGAKNPKRDAFLVELLKDRRPADQRFGLAGGERGVEGGNGRIRLDVQLEAVLGVEAARLHDIPDDRIEHRQGQAGYADLRLLLRERCGRPGECKRAGRCQCCQPATLKRDHQILPLISFLILIDAV